MGDFVGVVYAVLPFIDKGAQVPPPSMRCTRLSRKDLDTLIVTDDFTRSASQPSNLFFVRFFDV